MNKKVFDYFENLEKSEITMNEENNLIIDSSILEQVKTCDGTVCKYKKGKKHFYLKPWKVQSLHEIASSRMYNEIGILTPPCYVTTQDSSIVTEDVRNLEEHGLLCTLADDTFLKKILDIIPSKFFNNHKWEILYNKNLRKYFLKYMTEDCLDAYLSKCLADEIRSDGDGHLGNFFLYKTINKKGHVGRKFNGIIPIDLENSDLAWFIDAMNLEINNESFKQFLTSERIAFGPLTNWLENTYLNDITTLRECLAKGLIKNEYTDLLIKELEYDLPKEIKTIGKAHKTNHPQRDYEYVARLWDYHRKHIGKDLGL